MKRLNLDDIRIEIEQVIRCMPPRESMHHDTPENLEWLGRAGAVVATWGMFGAGNAIQLVDFNLALSNIHARARSHGTSPTLTIMRILFHAQNDLRMQTAGPINVVFGQGQVHQFFDEVRKILEQATTDIMFIDPYLNADFVSRYLPFVKKGVVVRLLGNKNIAGVQAAAELFAKEHNLLIEVRLGKAMHDRLFFIDERRCFQSGASFKDGGLNASTSLIENVDSFGVLRSQYEKLWAEAVS